MGRASSVVRIANQLLRTPQGKQVGGRVLDGVAAVADRVTSRRYSGRIDSARKSARRGLERL